MSITLRSNYTYEQEFVTVHSSMEDLDEKEDIISHDQMILIMKVLMFGVTPAISILGIIGNIFSIIILLKHGLHKCSNILLISLAVADLTYLVAFNSVPKILYEVVGVENGYGYSREISVALFYLFNVFNTLDYTAAAISFNFPMLITFERLVAVYLPFKFNYIITPVRTWCAVAVVYIFWFTAYVYMSFWFTFSYTFDQNYNISVGRMERSPIYNSHSAVVELLGVVDSMANTISPIFTFVGCIFIGVKVNMASRQRKKMTQTNSNDSSSNKTTKMLLAVCVVYMLTCAIVSMPLYIPQYVQYTMFSEPPSDLSPVMYQVLCITVCINSSANFVVYVVMNKKFRDTYNSLFTTCRRSKL